MSSYQDILLMSGNAKYVYLERRRFVGKLDD